MLLSGCTSGNAEQRTKVVVPAKPNAVVALGRIQPKGEVIKLSVANAQDSRVDRILVAEGDFVTQADRQGLGLLTAQAKLANAQAEYQRRSQFNRSGNNTLGSQAKLTNAQGEYRRKLMLYQSGAIGKSQLAKAEEELISTRAAVRERSIDTKTQLDRAAEDLAAARANLKEKQGDRG